MRILVTGNMGYVGPAVVRHFRSVWPKAELIGFDTGYFAQNVTGSSVAECQLDAQYFGDVRRFPTSLLEGVDAVVHLAAISNDPMGNQFELVTLDINWRASLALAKAARNQGVRTFVFASSCSVYGFAENEPRTESSELDPLTAYARSKVFTERDLEPLVSRSFSVTCLRFATACGFSDRLRLDLVLNDFVASAVAARKITILSDGTPWRPLIHVNDMARALEWAVNRRAEDSGPFLVVNAGSDEWNHQVRSLAQAVQAALPGTELTINSQAPPDRRSYRVNFTRFREVAPRHQPQVSLADAVTDLKAGLEQMGFRDAQFRESALNRLHTLRGHVTARRLNEKLEWNR